MFEIHTIDTSGNQLVVPIENENNGGGAASNEPLDSFLLFLSLKMKPEFIS